ncbi:hypothetical protein RQP46_002817 [Phenoliferia psychrophenolica]
MSNLWRRSLAALAPASTRSNSLAATLPPELLNEICGYFQTASSFSNLCAFSLVCRAWRGSAQEALFGVVFLFSDMRIQAYLKSSARPRYHLKGLYGSSINPKLEAKVRAACPAVGLSSLDYDSPTCEGHIWCASAQASGLKYVKVWDLHSFPIAAQPIPLRLRHLSLFLSNFHEHHPLQIRSILHYSCESLTTLELTSLGSETTAINLAGFFSAMNFDRVQHLIFAQNGPTLNIWPYFIASFSSLKTLEIRAYDKATVAAVGASAPAGLESLSLGGELDSIHKRATTSFSGVNLLLLFELLRVLRLPNLASLRRLAFPAAPASAFENAEGNALLEECEDRAISVFCQSGCLKDDTRRDRSLAPRFAITPQPDYNNKIIIISYLNSVSSGDATPPTFHLLALTLVGRVPDPLLAFLTTHSHDSLRSLSLNYNKRDQPNGPSDVFDDLAPFTSLTSLSVWGYISSSIVNLLHTPTIRTLSLYNLYEPGAARPDLSDVLLRLPPTLQSLTIKRGGHLSPPKFTAWIESDACPILSHVSWGKTSLEADAFEALQRVCKTRALILKEVKSGVAAADDYGDEDLYEYECPPFEDDDWSGGSEEGEEEAGDRPEVEPTKSGSLLRYL